MKHPLVSRNQDLNHLWDDGLEIEIRNGKLLVHHVPYVNSEKVVKFGTLVSELSLDKDNTIRPATHTVHFEGEHPCHKNGFVISQIQHSSQRKDLGDGVVVDHMFSNKPKDGYTDYHHKITTYIGIISAPAQAIDKSMTAYTFQVIENSDSECVFCYVDTNSAEAEISAVTSKLRGQTIAIIGLGGTGSYVLDFVAKTEVREIRLIDGDYLLQKNAFRSPGATPFEVLGERIKKTDYFKGIYAKMHKNIVSDPVYIDSSNTGKLDGANFAFVCVDDGPAKKPILDYLISRGIPFIDVGMGIVMVDDINALTGIVRTTACTPGKQDHIQKRISFAKQDRNNLYSRNIQIAELNALNATMAVVRWKKLCGFYQDLTKEHNSAYSINTGEIVNEDFGS